MTWNAVDYMLVSIRTYDSTGQSKTSDIRVDAGTSDADIEAYIAKIQVESNGSIAMYTKHIPMTNDAAPAAVVFDKTVNPLNELSTSLQLDFFCGAAQKGTRTSILAPSNLHLVKGSFNKLRLDPASTSFTDIETAAIGTLENTGGFTVQALQTSQVEMNKSRGLL